MYYNVYICYIVRKLFEVRIYVFFNVKIYLENMCSYNKIYVSHLFLNYFFVNDR